MYTSPPSCTPTAINMKSPSLFRPRFGNRSSPGAAVVFNCYYGLRGRHEPRSPRRLSKCHRRIVLDVAFFTRLIVNFALHHRLLLFALTHPHPFPSSLLSSGIGRSPLLLGTAQFCFQILLFSTAKPGRNAQVVRHCTFDEGTVRCARATFWLRWQKNTDKPRPYGRRGGRRGAGADGACPSYQLRASFSRPHPPGAEARRSATDRCCTVLSRSASPPPPTLPLPS